MDSQFHQVHILHVETTVPLTDQEKQNLDKVIKVLKKEVTNTTTTTHDTTSIKK